MENKTYKAAMYLRLSKEDDDDKLESESIKSQEDIIRSFVQRHDDISICSKRVDDGFTGVDFQRPSFLAMLEDIREKRINCVIVKDLSRLGRNFIETGKYIENIFPFMGVRFIAINDDIDSLNPKTSSDNLIIPVKNLMNDAYCRDISVKIRSQFEVKRKRGDFIAPFATYGYLRDPEHKNKLIIDELAAPVVQAIFKMKLDGMSPANIADCLNRQSILSPMEHKKAIGLKFSTTFKVNPKAVWSATAIYRVLKNEVFIGTLIQGKKSSPNYKVKKRFELPESKWIRIENNHEAIIEKDVFHSVQSILKSDTRTAPSEDVVFPLAGLVFCGDCNSSMIRKNYGSKKAPYYYYVCSGHKNKNGCTSHSIRDIALQDAVFLAIKNYISAVLDLEQTLKTIENIPYTSRQVQKHSKRLTEKRAEFERYQNNKFSAYEDYRKGLLPEEDYISHRNRFEEKAEEAQNSIIYLEKEIESLVSGNTEGQKWIEYFKEHKNAPCLSRKLAVQLISKIHIYEGKAIHITFKFIYEYENAVAFAQSILSITDVKKAVM